MHQCWSVAGFGLLFHHHRWTDTVLTWRSMRTNAGMLVQQDHNITDKKNNAALVWKKSIKCLDDMCVIASHCVSCLYFHFKQTVSCWHKLKDELKLNSNRTDSLLLFTVCQLSEMEISKVEELKSVKKTKLSFTTIHPVTP